METYVEIMECVIQSLAIIAVLLSLAIGVLLAIPTPVEKAIKRRQRRKGTGICMGIIGLTAIPEESVYVSLNSTYKSLDEIAALYTMLSFFLIGFITYILYQKKML